MIPWARRIETLWPRFSPGYVIRTYYDVGRESSSFFTAKRLRGSVGDSATRGDGKAVVFMVGGGNRGTVQQSVAGTHVHVLSVSRLFRDERTVTDPKFCEGFEILLVSTSNCVFLPASHAETTLSRRVWLDLYHKRGIHERRSMDPNESVRLQLFCHPRD